MSGAEQVTRAVAYPLCPIVRFYVGATWHEGPKASELGREKARVCMPSGAFGFFDSLVMIASWMRTRVSRAIPATRVS